MKLVAVDAPSRSFSRWLTAEEIGQVLAHNRGWRLTPEGAVIAGKIRKIEIASSLSDVGAAALKSRWISRPISAGNDGSGPTHVMWGIIDARSDAEIAEQFSTV